MAASPFLPPVRDPQKAKRTRWQRVQATVAELVGLAVLGAGLGMFAVWLGVATFGLGLLLIGIGLELNAG